MSANVSVVEVVEVSSNAPRRRGYKNNVSNVEIIKAVELHPCLYDIKDRDYGNPMNMGRAWSSIAREVLESENFVKKRWQQLKQRYVKYRRCILAHKPAPLLKHAEQLCFLDPHITIEKRRGSFTFLHSSNNIKEEKELFHQEESSCEVYEAVPVDGHVKNAEFYKEEDTVDLNAMVNVEDPEDDAKVDDDNSFENSDCQQEINQELTAISCLSMSDTAFANYVLATLAELPINKRNQVKAEISCVLLKCMNTIV